MFDFFSKSFHVFLSSLGLCILNLFFIWCKIRKNQIASNFLFQRDTKLSQYHTVSGPRLSTCAPPWRGWYKWGTHPQGHEGLQHRASAFFSFVSWVPCLPHPVQALRSLSPSLQGIQSVAWRLVLIIRTRILGLLPRNVGSPGRCLFMKREGKEPWNLQPGKEGCLGLEGAGWGAGMLGWEPQKCCFLRLAGQEAGTWKAFPSMTSWVYPAGSVLWVLPLPSPQNVGGLEGTQRFKLLHRLGTDNRIEKDFFLSILFQSF